MLQDFSSTLIAELICTRISHDLIGNIGAVSNAVELLDDDPESVEDVKPILEISSKVLSDRLKFFRLAFGLSNASVRNIDELKTIAQNYVQTIGNRNFPIKLNLQINTPEIYKMVLLGVMSLADMFIKGGTLSVAESQNGLVFSAKSEHILSGAKLKAIQDVLNGILPDENPAQNAPVVYLQDILKNFNASIKLDYNDNVATMQIV